MTKGKSEPKTGKTAFPVELPNDLVEAMSQVKRQYGTPRNLIVERLVRKWVENGCDMATIASPNQERDK